MNSQNFSVDSHLLKFISLCYYLCNNLLSNHTDDTLLTIVIIVFFNWVIISINCNFILKLLQYYITSYSHANKAYVVVDMSY